MTIFDMKLHYRCEYLASSNVCMLYIKYNMLLSLLHMEQQEKSRMDISQ